IYLVRKNRGTSKNEQQGEHNLYAAQGFLQCTINIAQDLGGEYHDCSTLLEEWTRQNECLEIISRTINRFQESATSSVFVQNSTDHETGSMAWVSRWRKIPISRLLRGFERNGLLLLTWRRNASRLVRKLPRRLVLLGSR